MCAARGCLPLLLRVVDEAPRGGEEQRAGGESATERRLKAHGVAHSGCVDARSDGPSMSRVPRWGVIE